MPPFPHGSSVDTPAAAATERTPWPALILRLERAPATDSAGLFENLGRDPERRVGGRYAAVDRRLQQHFLDLVLRHTVVQGAAQVKHDLLLAVERDQHGHSDAAAGTPVEARTGP